MNTASLNSEFIHQLPKLVKLVETFTGSLLTNPSIGELAAAESINRRVESSIKLSDDTLEETLEETLDQILESGRLLLDKLKNWYFLTPEEWSDLIVFFSFSRHIVLEYWNDIPTEDRNLLNESIRRFMSPNTQHGQCKKRTFQRQLRSKALNVSLKYASWRLRRDLAKEFVQELLIGAQAIIEKAGIIPGWNTSRMLILADEARDAFLKDAKDLSEPPKALVVGMEEFWTAKS